VDVLPHDSRYTLLEIVCSDFGFCFAQLVQFGAAKPVYRTRNHASGSVAERSLHKREVRGSSPLKQPENWRNTDKRTWLNTKRPQGQAGSNPAFSTKILAQLVRASVF
jgi:hypothetical protein